MEFLPKQNFTNMKTTLTFIFLLGITTVFAQSTASTSTPNSGTDKSKTGFGPKTDTRNPFDTTKVKGKPQMKNGIGGWGDDGGGVAPKENSYVGETEKNKTDRINAPVKERKPNQSVSDDEGSFGKTKVKKTNDLGVGEDPFGKSNPKKTKNLGIGNDPFEKSKKNSAIKKKSSYANQEVSY